MRPRMLSFAAPTGALHAFAATLAAVLSAGLVGCSNRVERFDSYPRYSSDYSRLGGPSEHIAGLARVVTVGQGDSLDLLSRRFGITKQALRDANGLKSDRLAIGQTLLIPAAR